MTSSIHCTALVCFYQIWESRTTMSDNRKECIGLSPVLVRRLQPPPAMGLQWDELPEEGLNCPRNTEQNNCVWRSTVALWSSDYVTMCMCDYAPFFGFCLSFYISVLFTTHPLAISLISLSRFHPETICMACLAAPFALEHHPGHSQSITRLTLGQGGYIWFHHQRSQARASILAYL